MSRRHKRPADATEHAPIPETVRSRSSRGGDGMGLPGLEEVISLVSGSRQGIDGLLRVAEECRSLMRVATIMPAAVELHACVDAALQAACTLGGCRPRLVRRYGELPPVPCDPELLSHLLSCLLGDAVVSCGDIGRLEVVTGAQHDHAVLCLTDDPPLAIGQPAPVPSDDRRLGQSIATALAQRHGGHLVVASRPGGATEVTVHLPLFDLDDPGIVRH